MSFTRFHDDPSRIKKQSEELSFQGRYFLNTPGQGMDLPFEEPICPDQVFEFVPHSTPAQIANEIISKIAI